MAWQGILGHDKIVEFFRRAAQRGRLSGSYLFIGPDGIGKRRFAVALAKSLLCLNNPESDLNPCGTCASCKEIDNNSHPDLEIVQKPADKSLIPLELLIGDVEHRNSEGLCHFLSVKPQFAKRKIAILDDADFLNAEGANAMLKTLEEPPPNALFILLGTSAAKQLPTIRSRCRIVRFDPLSQDDSTQILQDSQIVDSPVQARLLASIGQGSLANAVAWKDPEFLEFRQNILKILGEVPFDPIAFSKLLQDFAVQGDRKDNASKKRMVIHLAQITAIQFFITLSRAISCGIEDILGNPQYDDYLVSMVKSRLTRWKWDAETANRGVEITLKLEEMLIRNVHPMLLCDAWADSLAELFNTGIKS